MKTIIRVLLFAGTCLFLESALLAKGSLVGISKIEQLAVALSLTDYPTQKERLYELVGLPRDLTPLLVVGRKDEAIADACFALSDPKEPLGYYVLRYAFKEEANGQSDGEQTVLSAGIEFWMQEPGVVFVVDGKSGWSTRIPELRKLMKERGLTPGQLVETLLRPAEGIR